jgi:hypothetical protein
MACTESEAWYAESEGVHAAAQGQVLVEQRWRPLQLQPGKRSAQAGPQAQNFSHHVLARRQGQSCAHRPTQAHGFQPGHGSSAWCVSRCRLTCVKQSGWLNGCTKHLTRTLLTQARLPFSEGKLRMTFVNRLMPSTC